MEVSVQQEIGQIEMGRPHVVILGAGASYAAFPNGDKHGRKLPLMNNLVEILGLKSLLARTKITFETDNFEDIYDKIHKSSELSQIRGELEKVIYTYFNEMELPETPTIYDHLLLSLRDKDVVATFNWDPFLIQAFQRNSSKFKLPRLLFLHGNVKVGGCEKDNVLGAKGNRCSRCQQLLKPSKLLYPISEKNYHRNSFISGQWDELSRHLKDAFMITIFGYGAPKSDVSAISLLKSAWGDVYDREMEQTEIIDIRTEDELSETWEQFIHSHHYDTFTSFYDSWLANHPRRTGEAYLNQFLKAQFIENNPIPKEHTFWELWEWFEKLQEIELQNIKKST